MTPESTQITVETPAGLPLVLSPDEYRLALLWLTDFEQAWDGIEAAAAFVPDGAAKRALIQARLQPLAGSLTGLGQQVDALTLLAARHWFRTGACAASPAETEPA